MTLKIQNGGLFDLWHYSHTNLSIETGNYYLHCTLVLVVWDEHCNFSVEHSLRETVTKKSDVASVTFVTEGGGVTNFESM